MARHTAALWSLALCVLVGCSGQTNIVDGGTGTTSGTSSSGGTSTGGTGGLTAGSPCTANGQCLSDVCGAFGHGNCCASQCPASADSACNPIGCDATNGACVYPVGNGCGTRSCSGRTLSVGQCDASGACQPQTSTCPDNLACNGDGTDCLASCNSSADCAPNLSCNTGVCASKVAIGPCSENDDCTSGICGVAGHGYCCTSACSTEDLSCKASGCDATGACQYPDNSIACGPSQVCIGLTQIDAYLCDGMGSCATPTTVQCAPFICGNSPPPSCLTSCQDATSCIPGAFCDSVGASCCFLGDEGLMSVDAVLGDDTAGCCGIGATAPCQTLTRAMGLINQAGAANVIITATVDGGGGDWMPAGEIYPIVLGWGVELNAPGVYFNDVAGNSAIFDVSNYSSKDGLGSASIVGTAESLVGIGMNAANTVQTTDSQAIEVDGTLYIANASLNSNVTAMNSAMFVLGDLTLGSNKSGTITGTVHIGNSQPLNTATDGMYGITTDGHVVDAVIPDGGSSVVFQGLEGSDFLVVGGTATLTSNPVFGVAPPTRGIGACGNKGYAAAVVAVNGSSMTLSNATVQCMSLGVALEGATVTLSNTLMQNCSAPLLSGGGLLTVTNTTMIYSVVGAQQWTGGTIDLSGGGNTIICNSANEDPGYAYPVGMGAYNQSTTLLNASNVAWDTPGPDYYSCNSDWSVCTCNLASCTVPAGSDGLDAVEDSTNLGGIDTSGNTMSEYFLDAGCQ